MRSGRDGVDIKNVILLIVIGILIVIIGVLVYLYYFGGDNGLLKNIGIKPTPEVTVTPEPTATPVPEPTPYPVNKEGTTIEERFPVPEGYERIAVAEGSFADFLRKFPLKPYGSPAYTFEGVANQDADVVGVFNQSITPRDLQQCADAIMRLWAEYLYAKGEYDKIVFDLYTTPVFKCDFDTWAKGKRIKVEDGNKIVWVDSTAQEDYSYENFRKYLDIVHVYANTASLQQQMSNVLLNQLTIGDVFIMTAQQMSKSYGHAAIIVDMAVHKETGEKIFIVAEGNMPATETYIVVNDDEMMGVWHKLNENNEFVKKDWTCPAMFFRRFG